MSAGTLSCLLCQSSADSFAAVFSGHYFRCPDCSLIFQHPDEFPSRAEERAYYDTHRNDVDDPGYRRFLARMSSTLFPRLPAGASGLDFGCGPAAALVAMAREAGFDMHGYDPLFADEPALMERQYDFVTCTETVEHFHSPLEGFAQLDAVLVPGGWLGVMTSEPPRERESFERWHYHRDPTHVCFFSRKAMRTVAQRFGWRCEFPAPNVSLFRKPAS